MRTLGIDLAAEPANTAIAVLEWRPASARVITVEISADDAVVLRHAGAADKVGIDCPLGWPDTFVEFVCAQRDNRFVVPNTLPSAEWRRSLAYRRTDEHVRTTLGINPLSVATDRIGITAMRAACLQVLLAGHGHSIDRIGTGLLVEVYPAAGLKCWGLTHNRYKGNASRPALSTLVDELKKAAPWLELGDAEALCRQSDHVLDAIIAALLARAATLGLTTPPPPDDLHTASREGWIAVPACALNQLAP